MFTFQVQSQDTQPCVFHHTQGIQKVSEDFRLTFMSKLFQEDI